MKKNIIYSIALIISLLNIFSCKEQGSTFLHLRKVNNLNFLTLDQAYLHIAAKPDTVIYAREHYAEVTDTLLSISDSITLLQFGHCYSNTVEEPNLKNAHSTSYTTNDFPIDHSSKSLIFTSKIHDLQLDTLYKIRTYVIVKNKSTGRIDTGYNQVIKAFRAKAEDLWLHLPDINGDPRTEATSFVIKNNAYILTGAYGSSVLKDMWRFNDSTNEWTQLPDFAGDARMSATAFVIDDTAYVGTGLVKDIYNNYKPTADMWKWTEGPRYNSWKRIDSLGINAARYDAVAFVVADKYGIKHGYIGLGKKNNGLNNQFFRYEPALDTAGAKPGDAWVQIQTYGGITSGNNVTQAVATVLDNIAYVGTGIDQDGKYRNDFYAFDATVGISGAWHSIEPMPDKGRRNAVAFSLSFTRPRTGVSEKYIYVGTGVSSDGTFLNDLWRFNFTTLKWEKCSDMRQDEDIAPGREGAISFVIQRHKVDFGTTKRGFVAFGNNNSINYMRDVWEYLP